MSRQVLLLWLASVWLLLGTGGGWAGQNARAYAKCCWLAPNGSLSLARNSQEARPTFAIVVGRVSHLEAAEIQLAVSSALGGVPPLAWSDWPGGCAYGRFTLTPGGTVPAFPDAFAVAPAVPGMAVLHNEIHTGLDTCGTASACNLFYLQTAAATGVDRDSTREYVLWTGGLDLSGDMGPCDGDMSLPASIVLHPLFTPDPLGPTPCSKVPKGVVLALTGSDGAVDYVPFAAGYCMLQWYNPTETTFLDGQCGSALVSVHAATWGRLRQIYR